MKKIACFCTILAIVALSRSHAQTQVYPVSGKVIDKVTGEGVPYAAVIIVGLEGSGILADSTGVFTLPDVKPGIS
ncbi:MAG: hypothetical protein IJ005_08105 [Bacteroidales bacterium]|nr:hypothetical protein [Bacteroidales bacterium]